MLSHYDLLKRLQKDRSTSYRYLLLDPLKAVRNDEPLELSNIKSIFTKNDVVPLLRPDLTHEPDSCPHLILLAKPNEDIEPELLDLTLVRSQREHLLYKHYICGWICSEFEIQNLAEKIINLGNELGYLHSSHTPSFFPFYEHIRLELLQESLPIEGLLSEQFNFAQSYIYNNYYGQLTDITSEAHLYEDIPPQISRSLLQQALQYQHEPKAIYGLIKLWSDNVGTLPHGAIFLSAKKLLEAKDIGFINLEDRLIYGLYSLIYQVDLMKIESVSPHILAATATPGSLKDYLASVDSTIWKSAIE